MYTKSRFSKIHSHSLFLTNFKTETSRYLTMLQTAKDQIRSSLWYFIFSTVKYYIGMLIILEKAYATKCSSKTYL